MQVRDNERTTKIITLFAIGHATTFILNILPTAILTLLAGRDAYWTIVVHRLLNILFPAYLLFVVIVGAKSRPTCISQISTWMPSPIGPLLITMFGWRSADAPIHPSTNVDGDEAQAICFNLLNDMWINSRTPKQSQ